jgi:hypothetical protein
LRVLENEVLRRISETRREEVTGDGENYKVRNSINRNLQYIYYYGDQIKADEMAWTCSMHVSYEKCIQKFTQET